MLLTRRINYQSIENERLINQNPAPVFNLCSTKSLFNFIHPNRNLSVARRWYFVSFDCLYFTNKNTYCDRKIFILVDDGVNNGEISAEDAPQIILYLVQRVLAWFIFKLCTTHLNVDDIADQS